MPVTFSPFPQTEISPTTRRISSYTAHSLLESTQRKDCEPSPKAIVELLQSTFGRGDAPTHQALIPQRHGLIHTVLEAYNQHHALILRPDDVWLAILSQFSLFVNGKDGNNQPRADQLRGCFVAHEGKRMLTVTMSSTRSSVNYAKFADLMVDQIDQAVIDPLLKAWMIPAFSTTTPNDRVVASVMTMATLKTYFTFEFNLRCGIPQVTLMGTRTDWIEIFRRVDKLTEYGPDAIAWLRVLKPVLARLVRSFDPSWADSKDGRAFWQRIVHYQQGGSSGSFLSGWITAFSAFNDKGRNMVSPRSDASSSSAAASSSKKPHVGEHHQELDYTFGVILSKPHSRHGQTLEIDAVPYHVVDTKMIPSAYADVDVRLNDNGQCFDTVMVAGLVGMIAVAAHDRRKDHDLVIENGEVAPVAAWWMYMTGP